MKNKVYQFLLLVLLMPFGMSLEEPYRGSDIISFEFAFEFRENPVPRVVFYKDTINRDNFSEPKFGYEIKVSQKQFEDIKMVVEKESSYIIIDSFAARFYDIIVQKNKKMTVYGTVNFNRTKELVSHVIEVLRGAPDSAKAAKAFEFAYDMIGTIKPCVRQK